MVLKRPSRPSESVSPGAAASPPVWTSEIEMALFSALIQHKVAGPAKHFQMALVIHQLNQEGFKDITAGQIWTHLKSLYSLPAIDEIECCSPWVEALREEFGDSPVDFAFPKKEWQGIIADMRKNGKISANVAEFETPTPIKEPIKETPTPQGTKRASNSSREGGGGSTKGEDTPKSTAPKRPTRSTPGSTPAKRRK